MSERKVDLDALHPGMQVKIWCVMNGVKHAELAREMEIDRRNLSRWLNGLSTPIGPARVLLEQRTGVPRASWVRASRENGDG